MSRDRVILHSDLNGFYAAVECCYRPEIRHLPVAVCGDAEARHGIILAKNEIAKSFGIKTGQVIWQAKQLCPKLFTVRASFGRYMEFSKRAREIYLRYSDRVESFGIDECWLDVTSLARNPKEGEEIAGEIRAAIKSELGITASVGVSFNKIFAKLGSDIKKPDATTVISRDNFRRVVFGLPAADLLMVGRATSTQLAKYGIFTIGQLAEANPDFLTQRFGKCGGRLWTYANGFDNAPVALASEDVPEKSIGNSTTAARDLKTLDDIKMIVTVLSESVAERMRDRGLLGKTVHLGVRDRLLETWGKQRSIVRPTSNSHDIITAALSLFSAYDFSLPVRSLSVRMSDLCPAGRPLQTDMFVSEINHDKCDKLEQAIDNIRGRFGHFSIRRATEHLDTKLTAFTPKLEPLSLINSFLTPPSGLF